MNYSKLFPLLLCLGLASCSDEGLSNDTKEKDQKTQNQTVSSIKLKILLNSVRIRAESNSKAKVITKVSSKDKVVWAGDVSSNRDSIKLRGVKFQTPWLKVKTSDQKEGWIYAATTNAASSGSNLSEQFTALRSQSFFGDDLANQMTKYRSDYHTAKTDNDFANTYQDGQKIRDKVVQILEKKANVDLPKEMDMTWLEAAMPGYVLSYVAEGTQYYLFANFKKMLVTAEATEGNVDDNFLRLASDIYASQNGTEGFFYTWFEQTWDYGGESLLGQGKHFASLKKLTDFSQSSSLFGEQVAEYTSALVNDIASKEGEGETDIVKEDKAKKVEELTSILGLDSPLLSKNDIAIIEKKRSGMTQ